MLQVSLQDAARTCVNARRFVNVYSRAFCSKNTALLCLHVYFCVST